MDNMLNVMSNYSEEEIADYLSDLGWYVQRYNPDPSDFPDDEFKITEQEYLKDPDKYIVHFIGFNDDGTSWAMVHIKEE